MYRHYSWEGLLLLIFRLIIIAYILNKFLILLLFLQIIVLFHLSGLFPILYDFFLFRIPFNHRLCFKLFIMTQIMRESLIFLPPSLIKDFIDFSVVYVGYMRIPQHISIIIIFEILSIFLPFMTFFIIKFSLISFIYFFLLFSYFLLLKFLFIQTLIQILFFLLLHSIFHLPHFYVFIILGPLGLFIIYFTF